MVAGEREASPSSPSSPPLSPQPPTSSRSNKPIMEKKRRARINRSLNQLKSLIEDSYAKKTGGREWRLEKADILELTVRRVQELEARERLHSSEDSFVAGWRSCLAEVARYPVEAPLKPRLLKHLIKLQPATGASRGPASPGPRPAPPASPPWRPW